MHLPITKKQVEEYAKYVQQAAGDPAASCGTAMNSNWCPLAMVYKWLHPETDTTEVSMGLYRAHICGDGCWTFDYKPWQSKLIRVVDDTFTEQVPADRLLKLLKEV